MHPQCREFLERTKAKFPINFAGVTVLEIGSYNINGSVREHFPDPKEYIGVDLMPGPGVDLVGEGQRIQFARQFDTVISTECFEHNPYWAGTFRNMVKHTRPGGLVVMTCASTGRAPHGLSTKNPDDSPGTLSKGWDHYENLTAESFAHMPIEEWFSDHEFEYNPTSCDLYFWGVKR